jgi:hypothetical protein
MNVCCQKRGKETYIARDLKCRAFSGVGNVWGKQGHLLEIISTKCTV